MLRTADCFQGLHCACHNDVSIMWSPTHNSLPIFSLVFVSSNSSQEASHSSLSPHCQTPSLVFVSSNSSQQASHSSLSPHGPTPSLAFVSSNSSQQASHSSLSPPRPDSLTRVCLIKLFSTGFSLRPISPTAQLPHLRLSHQTPFNKLLTPAYPPTAQLQINSITHAD